MVLVVDSQEPNVQVVIGNVLEEAGSGVNSVCNSVQRVSGTRTENERGIEGRAIYYSKRPLSIRAKGVTLSEWEIKTSDAIV